MKYISWIISFILHIDKHLVEIVNSFGNWTYVILFLMVFIETGVVIFPFLPGDSLIFAASALSANPDYHINVWLIYLIFFAAAVLGDSLNYEIGKSLGNSASKTGFFQKLINPEKVAQAESFFKKHGEITILLARFMPFIRTFIPFVAGASKMPYRSFLRYNIIGGFLWVTLFMIIGYFFGGISVVQEHFSLFVIAIIIVSLIPVLIAWLKNRKNSNKKEAA